MVTYFIVVCYFLLIIFAYAQLIVCARHACSASRLASPSPSRLFSSSSPDKISLLLIGAAGVAGTRSTNEGGAR